MRRKMFGSCIDSLAKEFILVRVGYLVYFLAKF